VIEEIGVVVSVDGDMAEVEGQRRSTCGSCAVNGACGTSLIDRYLGRKRSLLRAYNPIGAGPGDPVVLGVPEGALLEASFVAYLVPVLAMIGGAIAGDYTAGRLAPAYAQAMSVLGGLGALAAAIWWLGRFSRAKSADDPYRPRILGRAGRVGPAVRISVPEIPGKHQAGGA
jgi:sigma-E factor negative regulatory protein RseC